MVSKIMKRTIPAGCFLLLGFILIIFWTALQTIFTFHEIPTTLHRVQRSLQSLELSSNNSSSNDSDDCLIPAVEQFPHPLMSKEMRLRGGLAIHFLVSFYMFLALAVVCDEYFVPSLEGICRVLKVESDVAGATFMAAGSSAPELATSVIAVFISKDDIGVGTVVGSAVYNIAFVVGICGLFSGRTIHLRWWPLVRDCFFYTVSIVAMLLTIYDEKVTWVEATIFLALYAFYIIFMAFNTKAETWLTTFCNRLFKKDSTTFNISEYDKGGSLPSVATTVIMDSICPIIKQDNSIEEEDESVFRMPQGSWLRKMIWIFCLPIFCCTYFTIPDCRRRRWRKCFFVTFLSSCIWISAQSYILVWMITIIGYTLSIPDTVMGLTFLAAGVSVPDAIASLLVAKEGLGDMAISNAVGSNVFDILLCLGLPWLLQTAIVEPGSTVIVHSKGLTYSTLTLLSTVIFLLVVTHLNKWRLNKRYGAVMMVWYVVFMCVASLYELNIFGSFNPPTCSSNF